MTKTPTLSLRAKIIPLFHVSLFYIAKLANDLSISEILFFNAIIIIITIIYPSVKQANILF